MQRRNVQIESGNITMALNYRDFKMFGMTPERYQKVKESLKSKGTKGKLPKKVAINLDQSSISEI